MERRIRADGSAGTPNGEPAAAAHALMERRIRGEGAARRRGSNGEPSEAREGEQVIRWERFLPRRSLRVLLVENDDSTRHIVSALLRKCNYQVVAVADGIKAWEFLREKNFIFDLVLTEVVTPSLSGIGLLSKIMNNEICKNIPVIMMSSQDSIGVVFKCMQKGAADFLVKPLRKNELRNLWQHVWRKCCSSSSGIGSENQTRFEAVCDNGAANNHLRQNVDNKSNTGDSVDTESDTQSTCSKPDTETKHERLQGEPLQTETGNFSEEIESKLEKRDSDPAIQATTLSMHAGEEEKEKLTGVEIKVTPSIQAAMSTEKIEENNSADRSQSRDGDPFSLRCKHDAIYGLESLDHFCQSNVRNEPSREFIDFIGTITTGQCSYAVLEDNSCLDDVLCEAPKTSDVKRSACNYSSSPLCERSLKRPHVNSWGENGFRERHILNHSDASAFSRYGNMRRLSCPKSGSSAPNICIKARESVNYLSQSGDDETGSGRHVPFSIKGRVASATNKEETNPFVASPSKEYAYVGLSSTEEVVFSCPQLGVLPLPIPDGAISFQGLHAGYGAIHQPVFYPEPSFSLFGLAAVQNAIEVKPYDLTGHGNSQPINLFQCSNCHHFDQHNCPHQLNGVKDQRVDEEPSDPRPVLHATEKAIQSDSYSQSNHNGSGSNRSNEDTDATVNAGVSLDSGNEDGFQNCNVQGLDRDRARREAALTKFRLKRKDRCFEKKVRYHSRKKLAEQRPRLKGQFARRAGTEMDA